ncbi:hypothetical protein [Paraburkholderia kirstenboschensis]|uniref:Uncharacterized protein n=1 Tax=Paraburkholderia kirstenboschensis TaxID=1245436 RepID=A0ABZ0EAN1_9BURK|nr:hypothetical protein [Paraburkholderia kirstenboschensis]WOD14293.1 hypothetical protein RW095_01990 [Paraburkholderia kirstenboschensis]
MIYKSAFRDIIYPAQNREPRATRYRIVLAKKTSRLVRAIVHLVADEPAQPESTDLPAAIDVILNRIIDGELRGVRHDCIRVVVQTGAQLTDYPITYNALELKGSGGRAPRTPGTTDQPIHIRSIDVVGGSVAFYMSTTRAASRRAPSLRECCDE